MGKSTELSAQQAMAITELGRRGSGGDFDQLALSELFAMGMIEVRSSDRRVVLTERGRRAYRELLDQAE